MIVATSFEPLGVGSCSLDRGLLRINAPHVREERAACQSWPDTGSIGAGDEQVPLYSIVEGSSPGLIYAEFGSGKRLAQRGATASCGGEPLS